METRLKEHMERAVAAATEARTSGDAKPEASLEKEEPEQKPSEAASEQASDDTADAPAEAQDSEAGTEAATVHAVLDMTLGERMARMKAHVRDIFERADRDKNGWLSKKELKKVIHEDDNLRFELRTAGGRPWKEFWAELDANDVREQVCLCLCLYAYMCGG